MISLLILFVFLPLPLPLMQSMEREFIKWMDFYGKSYGDFELVAGDFLDDSLEDTINSAT